MAGNPIRMQQMADLLERLEELEDELRQGKSDKEAMSALGIPLGALYRLEAKNEAAAERIACARRDGAKAMVSETIDIADELELQIMVDPVRSAQSRINVRQWLAAKRNREMFGEQAKVAVQVNVNNLHLTALRAGQQTPAIDVEVVDAELVQAPALPAADNLNDIL